MILKCEGDVLLTAWDESSPKWFKILKQTVRLDRARKLYCDGYRIFGRFLVAICFDCTQIFEGLGRVERTFGKTKAPSLVIVDKGRAYTSISRSGILVCFVRCYTPGLEQYLTLDDVQVFLKWIRI